MNAPPPHPTVPAKLSPREVRNAAGVSMVRVAVAANVSEQLVRMYEHAPALVKDYRKRLALDEIYARLADPHAEDGFTITLKDRR